MPDTFTEQQGAQMISLLKEIVKGISANGDKDAGHLKEIADELKQIQIEIKKRETFNQKLETLESILSQISSDVSIIKRSTSTPASPDKPLPTPS